MQRFNGGGATQILDGIENHLLDDVGFVEAHAKMEFVIVNLSY